MRNNSFVLFQQYQRKQKKPFFAHHTLEKKASVVVINEWNKLLLKALIQSFTLISISVIQFLEISR